MLFQSFVSLFIFALDLPPHWGLVFDVAAAVQVLVLFQLTLSSLNNPSQRRVRISDRQCRIPPLTHQKCLWFGQKNCSSKSHSQRSCFIACRTSSGCKNPRPHLPLPTPPKVLKNVAFWTSCVLFRTPPCSFRLRPFVSSPHPNPFDECTIEANARKAMLKSVSLNAYFCFRWRFTHNISCWWGQRWRYLQFWYVLEEFCCVFSKSCLPILDRACHLNVFHPTHSMGWTLPPLQAGNPPPCIVPNMAR